MSDTSLFILGALLTVIGTLMLMIFNRIEKSLERAIESINTLNIQVAKVIETIEYHDERLKKLENSQ